MAKRLILAINPGSTSTKFSLFEEDKLIFEKTLRHSTEDLAVFEKIPDQFNFRKNLIMNELEERKIDLSEIRAVVGRGGLVNPIESGVYKVNQKMKRPSEMLNFSAVMPATWELLLLMILHHHCRSGGIYCRSCSCR